VVESLRGSFKCVDCDSRGAALLTQCSAVTIGLLAPGGKSNECVPPPQKKIKFRDRGALSCLCALSPDFLKGEGAHGWKVRCYAVQQINRVAVGMGIPWVWVWTHGDSMGIFNQPEITR